ncbi:hypothetical protein MHTCC0001_13340 [Flavobacteriaceae bacterium MHTCC 0001]
MNFTKTTQVQILKVLKAVVLSIGFLLCSCDEDPISDQIQTNAPQFNIDLFEQNIIDYVNANNNTPIGWAYTINDQGNLEKFNAYGLARTNVDGAVNFTVNKEINVASVSKFYTAIAVMQLLEANNLTIEDDIAPWLPASWEKGQGVNGLSFKDLLKHESGLQSTNNNFDTTLGYQGLKDCIETGVVNPKSRNYLNVNFALFRVLIPSLWDAVDNTNAINIENDANTQFMYLLYMQENIFDRLDLPLVGCTPEDRAIATLYYNVNDNDTQNNGRFYDSWNNKSGGGGYFMSAIEMAKVNAFFEHTEVLVSNAQRNIMKTHRIGMDTADGSHETLGSYYGKGGSIGTGGGPSVSQGVRTHIAMFPNGIDCVVVMNCQGVSFTNNESLREMIYSAYNNAWE